MKKESYCVILSRKNIEVELNDWINNWEKSFKRAKIDLIIPLGILKRKYLVIVSLTNKKDIRRETNE